MKGKIKFYCHFSGIIRDILLIAVESTFYSLFEHTEKRSYKVVLSEVEDLTKLLPLSYLGVPYV